MRKFPLNPFLDSLKSDNINVCVSDYERIILALQTSGTWNITRLRDVLLALLAKNADQQDIFLRRFDSFFPPDAEDTLEDADIERVLENLRKLSRKPHESSKPRHSEKTVTAPKTVKEPVSRLRLWIALTILIMFAGVGIWQFLHKPQTSSYPIITCEPAVLNFGIQMPGQPVTMGITVTNKGPGFAEIKSIIISGLNSDSFTLGVKNKPETVNEKDHYIIPVTFVHASDSDFVFTSSLEIACNAKESPLKVELKGMVEGEVTPTSKSERKRLYTDIPYVKDIQYLPLEKQKDWQKYAGIGVLLLIIFIAYSLHLWHSLKIPKVKPARWDKDGPRHFSMISIGGKRSALLDDDVLDQLADSMGYFQGEQASNIVDVTASVKATVSEAGRIPVIKFNRRKHVRSLLVLEDTFAEATVWNSIANELVTGMKHRGVPVLYGLFNGLPEEFKTEDGSVYQLEDLEDQRQGYIVLIFTDGKGIQGLENTFVLERLSRWPMVAWMELREKRFWDETSSLPAAYCIPVYPASPDGIIKAVKRFLAEQGTGKDLSEKSFRVQHPVEMPARLDAYVEYLLGEALLWAQDCAMIQPVSQGMADTLRRRFHPYLPAERIERLFALPDTFQTASGLRFSNEVLRALRAGFQNRRNGHEQEEVLKFLLEKVWEAEPKIESDRKDSLQHLKWEAVKERISLELDPDYYDGERLAELAQTPIGLSISEGFENFGFRGKDDKIPLRIKPNALKTLQRLAQLDGNPFNIPKLKAFPIRLGQWVVVGMLIMSLLGFSAWSVNYFLEAAKPVPNFKIANDNILYTQIEIQNNDRWEMLEDQNGYWVSSTFVGHQFFEQPLLPENRNYRITLYNNGYRTEKNFRIEKEKRIQMVVAMQDIECLCQEKYLEIGLVVERCAETTNSTDVLMTWKGRLGEKAPKDRQMSIGLEFSGNMKDDFQLRQFRNTLFQTNSVDVLYRIQPDNNGKWHIEQALKTIQTELSPWIEESQLIWWRAGRFSETVPEEDFPKFERILQINSDDDLSWVVKLENVFEPIPDTFVMKTESFLSNIVINENEILNILSKGKTHGEGLPLVLIRHHKLPRVTIRTSFKRNTDELTSEAKVQLTNFGNALQSERLRHYIYRIEGHTSIYGSSNHNLALSNIRAMAVVDFMVKNFNLPEEQFIINAYGSEMPIASNSTEAGRKKNNRIEIVNTLKIFDFKRPKVIVKLKCMKNSGIETLFSADVQGYAVGITPEVNSFVYIFQVDSRNILTQLFPNSEQNNPLEAGEICRIPRMGEWLYFTDGKDQLVVFAQKEVVNDPTKICKLLLSSDQENGMDLDFTIMNKIFVWKQFLLSTECNKN